MLLMLVLNQSVLRTFARNFLKTCVCVSTARLVQKKYTKRIGFFLQKRLAIVDDRFEGLRLTGTPVRRYVTPALCH